MNRIDVHLSCRRYGLGRNRGYGSRDFTAEGLRPSRRGSLLRTVLDRGHLIVGTGSTNAPWHFEDEQGKLVGMDIAMARILRAGTVRR